MGLLDVKDLAVHFHTRAGIVRAVDGVSFRLDRGGTLALDDAVTLIRHILIGDEVRKSDMLASLQADIEVVESRLVAIPFEPTKVGLRCAITGVTVRNE